MKKTNGKLLLARETLLPLQTVLLDNVVGGAISAQQPDLTNSRNCGPCGTQYFCVPKTTSLGGA